MIYANVIGCDLGQKSRQSAALRRCSGCMFWRKEQSHLLGYYFRTGIIMTSTGTAGDAGQNLLCVSFLCRENSDMSNTIIYHNPDCGTSRNTLVRSATAVWSRRLSTIRYAVAGRVSGSDCGDGDNGARAAAQKTS